MLIEVFIYLWAVLLVFAVYFFAKSLNEAIEKGREEKARKSTPKVHSFAISPHHSIPAGHGKRRPAH